MQKIELFALNDAQKFKIADRDVSILLQIVIVKARKIDQLRNILF